MNREALAIAKQNVVIMQHSMNGCDSGEIDLTDYLPYPHHAKAIESKLKLEDWEIQVILSHYDHIDGYFMETIGKQLSYLLVNGEVV